MPPSPFKLVNPSLILTPFGEDPTPVELKCSARQITHTIDVATVDDSTFCTPGAEGVGARTESIELTVLQSFGEDGLWNSLADLQLSEVTFHLFTVAGTYAVGSPVMTGTCLVPIVPFVDAGVGENTELTLTFPIQSGGSTSILTTAPPPPDD